MNNHNLFHEKLPILVIKEVELDYDQDEDLYSDSNNDHEYDVNDEINNEHVIVISHQHEICESFVYIFMICECNHVCNM